MTTVPLITRASRHAALMLMLAVSGIVLLACAGDRTGSGPGTHAPIDFPFLGFDSTHAREAVRVGGGHLS